MLTFTMYIFCRLRFGIEKCTIIYWENMQDKKIDIRYLLNNNINKLEKQKTEWTMSFMFNFAILSGQ